MPPPSQTLARIPGFNRIMDKTFHYQARQGSLSLSLFALAGLILLAAQLWEIMPGFVMIAFIPALLVSIAQLILTPVYGVAMSPEEWRIEAGKDAKSLPVDDIAYLRLTERRTAPDAAIVLSDGSEIPVPYIALPEPLILIREATSRGIPVRHV